MASDIVLFDGEKFALGFDSVVNARAKGALRIIECSETNLRQAVEQNKADIILVAEQGMQDSMHYRKTALDHIVCGLAGKKGIAFAFSFSYILNARNRAVVIGRIMQSIRLCRKHRVRMVFASFASDKWEMRAFAELKSFAVVLGMTQKEALGSLNAIEALAELKKKGSGGARVIG